MNVALTPELEEFIRKKLISGMYKNAAEVVREGLRLLAQQDALREARLEELRARIRLGVAQANRGELVDGEEVFARLESELDEAERSGQ